MPVYQGLSISGNIFTGKAKIYQSADIHIPKQAIDTAKTTEELQFLKICIHKLETEYLEKLQESGLQQLDKDILNTHLMILTDIEIFTLMENAIKKSLMTAPHAVFSSFEQVITNFEKMDNNYFAQRADDYKDVEHRLLKCLLGIVEDTIHYSPDDILFLHEITPSLVTSFAQKGIRAYCIERGSHTSHSAILTRAFGLTALVSKNPIINGINDGDETILDSEKNLIIINPDNDTKADYQKRLIEIQDGSQYLESLLNEPCITKDARHIALKANIEYPQELDNVIGNKCEGIGLFRTEFLYLNNQILPDEDKQTKIYSDILKGMRGLPVTFRTFDLGGDKLTHLIQSEKEENPYLGSRGIRFSLYHKSIFKTQIRAILKASVHGKANIMFPMIIGVDDFLQAKAVVKECCKELHEERIDYNRDIPLGVMIETPSAALCATQLARACDFFSLGTNDLVQYTLAVDRNNESVAQYYVAHHPAVLMLIKQAVLAAKEAKIPVSICGEMASNPMMVPLLIGLGIDELSVNPHQANYVKAVIRNCDERLFEQISRFNFNTDLTTIEYLIETLKPYYSII